MKQLKVKDGWKWTNGGLTKYWFSNEEKEAIREVKKVTVSAEALYNLIEDIDHSGLLDKLDNDKDYEWICLRNPVEELRAALREEWKKQFDGNLPHL